MVDGRFSSKIFPGARFGKLTVIERIPGSQSSNGRAKVRCRCDCGNITEPNVDNLSRSGRKSCGCAKYDGLRSWSIKSRKFKIGNAYGRLTVLRVRKGKHNLVCRCSCGKVVVIRSDQVTRGTRSCGCLNSEIRSRICRVRNRETAKYGGFSRKWPRTGSAWRAMLNRCQNRKQQSYAAYGAKGVKVCQFLALSPHNLKQIVGLKPSKRYTLDRYPIHDGNYTCGRCKECKQNDWQLNIRWATRKEQSLNRGKFNVHLEAFGRRLTKSQWTELTGLSWGALTKRLRRGWSVEKTLTTPDIRGNCYRPN